MTLLFLIAVYALNFRDIEPEKPVISELEKAVCVITGCADISDVDNETFENLQLLAAKKLKINSAGRVKLQESGLFSAYQIESVIDRRSRLGDICSLEELGTVDGFKPETVGAFWMFLSFEPSSAPPSFSQWSLDALGGMSYKRADGKDSWQYCSKTLAVAGGVSAAVAFKSEWNSILRPPQTPGWSICYDGNGVLSRVVVGNYYARFGQGLAQWSGTQFNSYSNPASLMKHPMGISRYASYSPSYACLGAAATFDVGAGASGGSLGGASGGSWGGASGGLSGSSWGGASGGLSGSSAGAGRWSITPFVDIGDYSAVRWTAGVNTSYYFKSGQAGLTAVVPVNQADCKARISADAQYTLRGVVLFGELCCALGCVGASGDESGDGGGGGSGGGTGGGSVAGVGSGGLVSYGIGGTGGSGVDGSDRGTGGGWFWKKVDSVVTAIAGVRFPLGGADCSVRLYDSMYERNATVSAAGSFGGGRYGGGHKGGVSGGAGNGGFGGGRHIWSAWTSFSYYPRAKGRTPAGKGQLKAQANYQYKPIESIELISRLDVRVKPFGEGNRYEFRENLRWYPGGLSDGPGAGRGAAGSWVLSGRIDVAKCADWSYLGYAEVGWKGMGEVSQGVMGEVSPKVMGEVSPGDGSKEVWRGGCEAYLQLGAFKVDNWEDRIYVYQRDVPQSFNVPAMYGRGVWMSAYSVLRPWRWMKIYLRGGFVAYPWARPSDTHKALSASAKVQIAVSF